MWRLAPSSSSHASLPVTLFASQVGGWVGGWIGKVGGRVCKTCVGIACIKVENSIPVYHVCMCAYVPVCVGGEGCACLCVRACVDNACGIGSIHAFSRAFSQLPPRRLELTPPPPPSPPLPLSRPCPPRSLPLPPSPAFSPGPSLPASYFFFPFPASVSSPLVISLCVHTY